MSSGDDGNCRFSSDKDGSVAMLTGGGKLAWSWVHATFTGALALVIVSCASLRLLSISLEGKLVWSWTHVGALALVADTGGLLKLLSMRWCSSHDGVQSRYWMMVSGGKLGRGRSGASLIGALGRAAVLRRLDVLLARTLDEPGAASLPSPEVVTPFRVFLFSCARRFLNHLCNKQKVY